ncbi:MAG TPA: pyridoxamine 5'-phosphate oxidase family protein [Candidatus Dormibacteraeota bacterium]|nr:pyridoxamine 5'-phosphate oxidase family protein [Candidatus Dormibacteraeota bacterium]
MASWGEFEAAEPRFAARVKKMMARRKHLTMATLRRDGSPRISGTEVEFAEGEVQIGSMPNALKANDLRRDPRIAIHGPTQDPSKSGRWRGEAKIAGCAFEFERDRFRIDMDEVVITSLGGRGLLIESWKPDRGYRKTDRE